MQYLPYSLIRALRDIIFCRYDLDLPVILDYEIWKASHMLFQNIPYDEDTDADNDSNDGWDDSWDCSERVRSSKDRTTK